MDTTVTGWGEALWVSLAGAMAGLFSALPRVLGFIVILIVGWIISGLIAGGVAALLRAVRFNDLANRAGVTGFVQNMGIRTDAAGFLGDLVRWFVRLIVLVVAFDALGLPAVSQVLQQFLLWMPNLVVALVILVIGGPEQPAAARHDRAGGRLVLRHCRRRQPAWHRRDIGEHAVHGPGGRARAGPWPCLRLWRARDGRRDCAELVSPGPGGWAEA
jgi:hypothetical protein